MDAANCTCDQGHNQNRADARRQHGRTLRLRELLYKMQKQLGACSPRKFNF